MKPPHITNYNDLLQHCNTPVYLYSIPSNKLKYVIPEIFSKEYDRWKIIVDRSLKQGLEFVINENIWENSAYSSLAEIYHILHVDKYIDGFINIRYNKKHWKIQPGIKRFFMVDNMAVHNVKFICFNKPLKNARQYINKEFNKTYRLLSTNLGYELQDPKWPLELQERVIENPIHVKIVSNKITMNNVLFFERKTFKSRWELVYENTNNGIAG